MSPLVILSMGAASFFGAVAGMIYCLRLVVRLIIKHIDEDPELDKIEIHVHMVGEEQ